MNILCAQMESVFFCFLHTFPFFDFQVPTLKALVQRIGHRFVIWVMVLSEIGVSQSFGGCYSLVRVQNQHFLEKVHSLEDKRNFHLWASTTDIQTVSDIELCPVDISFWKILKKTKQKLSHVRKWPYFFYLVDWRQGTHQQSSSWACLAESRCSSWPRKTTRMEFNFNVNRQQHPTHAQVTEVVMKLAFKRVKSLKALFRTHEPVPMFAANVTYIKENIHHIDRQLREGVENSVRSQTQRFMKIIFWKIPCSQQTPNQNSD